MKIIGKQLNSIFKTTTVRIALLSLIFQIVVLLPTLAVVPKLKVSSSTVIISKSPAKKYYNISENDIAQGVDKYVNITPFDMAVENNVTSTYLIKPIAPVTKKASQTINITADDVAIEAARPVIDTSIPIPAKENKAGKKQSSKDIVSMARHFWNEDSKGGKKSNIEISGTKTFEMKKADVTGDIGHFSTENFDSIPGFHLDQSLHLEIDGNITNSASVHAVLDDKDDEDRRFTINIDGPVWKFVMGDFPLQIDGTEFTLFRKEVRGVLAKGSFRKHFKSLFLFSQSKGVARREQFRGAGQQQEFRLLGSPVVQGSERVMIDGKLMVRGSDYLIDYDDGIVKFLPKVLPIEMTSWIVVEYEVSDKTMAFSRNLFGTRQIYTFSKNRELGMTWLREVDSSTPKAGDNASGTVTPMQHDIVGTDVKWQIGKGTSVSAETSVSYFDPNKNSEQTEEDKCKTGHAGKISITSKMKKTDAELVLKRVDKNFKLVGREGGVSQLGERGLVNDILTGRAKLGYRMYNDLKLFASGEKSETNLENDPALPSVSFNKADGGFDWNYKPKSRLEVRYLAQTDKEGQTTTASDLEKGEGTAVWDTMIKGVSTQAKLQRTAYVDKYNSASNSTVLQTDLNLGSEVSDKFSWNTAISRIAVDDGLVKNQLRSETRNYSLDMNYEPNRIFTARGIFQWRMEDDYLANSRNNTEIADSRLRFQPNSDIRSQLKYKVENTSKVLRDPNLDAQKYILPPSLPNSTTKKEDVVGRFENPVQKRTMNFTTDYRINSFLQAFLDWRHRDIEDQATKILVSTNDRRNYELRYNPMKKMLVTTVYEQGGSKNSTPKTELKDSLKSVEFRHEFYQGCILDATYEEKNEDDIYASVNDTNTKSKILDFKRSFSRRASLELGLQHNIITSKDPSTEFEKRIAVTLTPFSKSQRYKFFLNQKDISSKTSGTHYEGGVNFSQFIGTDTIIDGEVKKVHSSAGINGTGYDGLVANAKMVITF